MKRCRSGSVSPERHVTPPQTRHLAEPKSSVEHKHICHMTYPVLNPNLAVAVESFPEISRFFDEPA
jgi:hypothetical protein